MKINHLAAMFASVAIAAVATTAHATDLFENFNLIGNGVSATGTFELNPVQNGDGSFTLVDILNGSQTFGANTDAITGLSAYASADNKLFLSDPFVTFQGISWSTSTLGDFNFYFDGTGHFQIASSENGGGYPDGLHLANLTLSSAGVPEPASWALMISGFGLAGGLLRKRKEVMTMV